MPPPAGFLKDFLEMRKGLHKALPPASVAKDNKKIGKKGGETSDGVVGDLMGITVAGIIEKKLGKKDVSEYFQRMADRLTTEKMK